MSDLLHIQGLLLRWFKHHGSLSISQIRVGSRNILDSFNIESSYALLKIFFPIVRRGYIEFIGNGQFQISKPTILYYGDVNTAVGINILGNQKKEIINLGYEITEDEFEIIRFKTTGGRIKFLSETIGCAYSEPNILNFLSGFPTISDVINGFNTASVTTKMERYDAHKKKWLKNSTAKYGMYRTNENSQKLYLVSGNQMYEIPDISINPEGRPLAETYCAAKSGESFISFNRKMEELYIHSVNIPILIDRILRISSLYLNDGVKEVSEKTTYSHITPKVVKQLNRILETNIKVE